MIYSILITIACSVICHQYHMISLISLTKYLHATQWDPEDSSPSHLKHSERQETVNWSTESNTNTNALLCLVSHIFILARIHTLQPCCLHSQHSVY